MHMVFDFFSVLKFLILLSMFLYSFSFFYKEVKFSCMEFDVFIMLELFLFSGKSCKYNYYITGEQVATLN